MKSSHRLFHDRVSKEHVSSPGFTSQTICIAVSLCKHACKEVYDVKPGLDPCPLLADFKSLRVPAGKNQTNS